MLKDSRVVGHIPFHLANTKNRTGIVTHFILKPTNQGSLEIYGKAINRGGGLGMEIPCVYNFYGPRKQSRPEPYLNLYVENKYSEYYCYGCALVTLPLRNK